ncbi:MAG TPA: hypothetical protein VFS43_01825, partial [Polyangiaceae bacterium]|nr:hypothetical protein [Polyangiaceae bacterium]
MRWYVALLSEGPEPAANLVVEATSWQGALQSAFELRGEQVSLEQIAVELIPDGYRAVNTETRATYELRKAPEGAPLSLRGGALPPGPFADEDTFAPTSSELAEAEEAAAAELTLVTAPAEGALAPAAAAKVEAAPGGAKGAEAPEKKAPEAGGKAAKGPAAAPKPGGAKAPGAAAKAEVGQVPEAAPTLPVAAPPMPGARPAAPTRAFGSEGQAVADAKLRAGPPALPANKSAAKPPPLQQAPEAAATVEGVQILFSRGEDPSARSPLTYREVALCVPEGTAEPEAERILRQHLQALAEQLAPAPPGKYVAL